jgi:hypothetical protein
MKVTLWDILSVFVLMFAVGLGLLFAFVFIQPNNGVNPFPPPTLPASLILPSSTPTFRSLPPTWTSGPPQEIAALASITAHPSATWVVLTRAAGLPTYTLTPTRTLTPTVTLTPTRTTTLTLIPSGTPTRTFTPNLTNTALSGISTNSAATQSTLQALTQTSSAKTQSALQTEAAGTQTQAALPANPSSATDLNGVSNDGWQNSSNDPNFIWTAPMGANGYYVYFGTNALGTAPDFVTVPGYDPSGVATGTYYLRVRTRFSWGERQDWATIFTYRFDITPPSNPSSASDWNGTPSGTWQNTNSDPNLSWSAASDGSGVGIDYYNIYWGTDALGTSVMGSVYDPSANFDPGSISAGSYFLRIQTVDRLGNTSLWGTVFNFRFDDSSPSDPSGVTELVGDPNHPTPSFSWSGSSDGESGVHWYEIYWGSDPNGVSPTVTTASTAFHVQTALTVNGTYYLRVRGVDFAGNSSGWASESFVYTGGP